MLGIRRTGGMSGTPADPRGSGVRIGVARTAHGTATALFAAVMVLALAGIRPGLAKADNGVYLAVSVQVGGGTPVTTNVPETAVLGNYDLSEVLNGAQVSGMTLSALAQYVHVVPANITSATVSDPTQASSSEVLSGSQVVGGFPNDGYPTDSNPAYAVFRATEISGGSSGYINFAWPGGSLTGSLDDYLNVSFAVSRGVLDVGEPPVSSTALTAGGSVQFGTPTVLLANGAAAPGPYVYSWDFGDGSPAAAGASPSHLYSTAGTWDARVTVTDADGDQGVSSPPVVVQVGKSSGPTGSTGPTTPDGLTAPTNPGSPAPGGGNGATNGPSSGALTGEANVPAAPSTPKSGARSPKKKPKKTSHRRKLVSTAGGGSHQSGNGSGGSGGAAGSGTGGGSGAGKAGSGGAGSAAPGGAKAKSTGAGGKRGGGSVPPLSQSTPVPRGQFGVLIDSSGGQVPVDGPTSAWLSAVRAAARASRSRDEKSAAWQWLLGVIAVVIWVLAGALREVGPTALSRKRRRDGSGVQVAARSNP